MLQIQSETSEHKIEEKETEIDGKYGCEKTTANDRLSAPSTPQLERGRFLPDREFQDVTCCSDAKELLQPRKSSSSASKSVENTCDNSISVANTVDALPSKAEHVAAEEEVNSVDGSKTDECKLHRRFVQAVEQLGIEQAIPSKILELMKVEGLTRHNVASHLQVHTKQTPQQGVVYRARSWHTLRIIPTVVLRQIRSIPFGAIQITAAMVFKCGAMLVIRHGIHLHKVGPGRPIHCSEFDMNGDRNEMFRESNDLHQVKVHDHFEFHRLPCIYRHKGGMEIKCLEMAGGDDRPIGEGGDEQAVAAPPPRPQVTIHRRRAGRAPPAGHLRRAPPPPTPPPLLIPTTSAGDMAAWVRWWARPTRVTRTADTVPS
ncbi:hypothetical protein BHE74_00013384 [Ensete ventricosum]|nr:hypothetical protein BHE74_00013384 [Ensete ventricosum]